MEVVSYTVDVTKSEEVKYIKIKGFLNNFSEYFEINVIQSKNGTTVTGTVIDALSCKKIDRDIKEILNQIKKDMEVGKDPVVIVH